MRHKSRSIHRNPYFLSLIHSSFHYDYNKNNQTSEVKHHVWIKRAESLLVFFWKKKAGSGGVFTGKQLWQGNFSVCFREKAVRLTACLLSSRGRWESVKIGCKEVTTRAAATAAAGAGAGRTVTFQRFHMFTSSSLRLYLFPHLPALSLPLGNLGHNSCQWLILFNTQSFTIVAPITFLPQQHATYRLSRYCICIRRRLYLYRVAHNFE